MPHNIITIPRELRDRINGFLVVSMIARPYEYRYCVQIKDGSSTDDTHGEPKMTWTKGQENPLSTALIRSCKQLYDEGTEMLYGRNGFVFRHAMHLERFLSKVPPKYLDMIPMVVLDFGTCNPDDYTVVPRWFPLEKGLFGGWYEYGSGRAARKLAMDTGVAQMVKYAAGIRELRHLALNFSPKIELRRDRLEEMISSLLARLNMRPDSRFKYAADLIFENNRASNSLIRIEVTDFGRRGGHLWFTGLPENPTGSRTQRMADYGWELRRRVERPKETYYNVEEYSGLDAKLYGSRRRFRRSHPVKG